MQNEFAVGGFRWRDSCRKHCMNQLSGFRMLECQFTTSGNISTGSADKRMLVSRSPIDMNNNVQHTRGGAAVLDIGGGRRMVTPRAT